MKKDILTEERWVMWKAEKVAGRLTKVPYTINHRKASSTDSKTWTTYETAKATLAHSKNEPQQNKRFSGIGVVFTPERTLLGIDIDHVLNEKGEIIGEFSDKIGQLIKEAKTYTEISPSGTGLHLYLALTSSLTLLANRHAPFEAYTAGRYFTFTESPFPKKNKRAPIRTVSPDEALALLTIIGYPWGKESDNSTPPLNTAQPTTPIQTPSTLPASTLLSGDLMTDDEILDRMFSSKNGAKIEALYKGDTTAFAKDDSRADAALLNHLAFYTRKESAQMERIWLASPLGNRPKTQQRQDYRTRSINGAIKNCKEIYTPPSLRNPVEGLDLLFTFDSKKEKVFTQNTENMCRIMRKHPEFANRLRYDSFTDQLEFRPLPDVLDQWRPFEDADMLILQTRISILFSAFRKVGKDMVYDAAVKVAKENAIDSAADFIRSLTYDKTPRLDTWLTSVYGAPDNVYHRAVGSNWLKGLVKRLIEPGSKFDHVLVLEGPQGSKKSTSLLVLGQITPRMNWHVETTMSTDSKDFFEQFIGKAIIEFSEGETLSRTEVKKMKAIITTQVDRFRPSYGRISVDHPRRCVFAMTTNQDEYLKDETGNRRWLPVRVVLPEADVEWLRANRNQLLAEAYHRLTVLKETIYEFPAEETQREQDLRRISDPNEERICDWYYNELKDEQRTAGITIEQVNQGALHQGFYGPMKKYEEMTIADVLRRVLQLTKKRIMVNGLQAWRWVNEKEIALDATSLESATAESPDDEVDRLFGHQP